MKNLQFLIGAYAVVWIGVVYFIYTNIRRQRSMEKKIAELEKRST